MDVPAMTPHPPSGAVLRAGTRSAKESIMASLLDQARDAASPDVVRSVSGLIGANATTTGSGFATAIPTILAGLVTTASTPAGAQWVRSMINEGSYGAGTLDRLVGMLGGGNATDMLMTSGRHVLASLFGGKQQNVTDTIAQSANLSGSSARSLLCLAAPMVMGVLGREVATHGLDGSGLMNYLAGQRASIANVTPSAVANVLGLQAPSVSAAASQVERRYRDGLDVATTSGQGRLGAWVLPVLAALAGLAIVLVMHPPWGDEGVKREPSALPRQFQALTLPTGEKLDVRAGSFLAKFNAFLANTSDMSVPRRFVFDGLTFEPGSASLAPESGRTVDALGRTLKAYPNVRVSLEGFTDATGDAGTNKDLSFDRAHAIKERLVETGVAPERIATAGFGPERPVAPNDTEEGRARNRRTEVVVTSR
jgi:OmpA-OmpF porin, OOP family